MRPHKLLFINAMTNEKFDAVSEARTRNKDIVLVTYPGTLDESCSHFFSYVRNLLRWSHCYKKKCYCDNYFNFLSQTLSLSGSEDMSELSFSTDDSSLTSAAYSFNEKRHSTSNILENNTNSKNNIIFHLRTVGIIQSTTFIIIGKSSQKEISSFRRRLWNASATKTDEYDNANESIITRGLSLFSSGHSTQNSSEIIVETESYTGRLSHPQGSNNTKKYSVSNCAFKHMSEDDEMTSEWFKFVNDSNFLVCNNLGATMPPSWWGEDPSIIPSMFLVCANGELSPIFVGTSRPQSNDSLGDGHEELFPLHYIFSKLIEARLRRGRQIYRCICLMKQEYATILSSNDIIEKIDNVSSIPLPLDIMLHVFDFLDERCDVYNMKLVSKREFRLTQSIMLHRLRTHLNYFEPIFPPNHLNHGATNNNKIPDHIFADSHMDDFHKSSFARKVRAFLTPNRQSGPSTLSKRSASNDTLKTASTKTTSSSSYYTSDISDWVDKLDKKAVKGISSPFHIKHDSKAQLWMGWGCHLLTSALRADEALSKVNFRIDYRETGAKKVTEESKQLIVQLRERRMELFDNV